MRQIKWDIFAFFKVPHAKCISADAENNPFHLLNFVACICRMVALNLLNSVVWTKVAQYPFQKVGFAITVIYAFLPLHSTVTRNPLISPALCFLGFAVFQSLLSGLPGSVFPRAAQVQ